MPHLTYVTSSLLLFVFLISSILHHHPALLHHHTLILDRLLTFLMAFSTLVSKLSFSESLSLHSHLSLPVADLMNYDHSLFGSHWRRSIGKYDRLSQPCSWLLVRTYTFLSHFINLYYCLSSFALRFPPALRNGASLSNGVCRGRHECFNGARRHER